MTINPTYFFGTLTVLVLVLVGGAGIRQYHYLQFERQRRGKQLADLIFKMVCKEAKGRTSSLVVEKSLVKYVINELLIRMPYARVERVGNNIQIKMRGEKWTVPISGYHKE